MPSLDAFVDGCGLLFLGDFVTSMNVLLLYNSLPEGIMPEEAVNAAAVLQQYICAKLPGPQLHRGHWRRRNLACQKFTDEFSYVAGLRKKKQLASLARFYRQYRIFSHLIQHYRVILVQTC